MKKFILLIVLGTLIGGGFHHAFALDEPIKPLVVKVDVVMYQVQQPREFFDFLVDVMGLSVTWEYRNFGSYSSGGVGCGNVTLESLSLKTPPNNVNGIYGISLQPALKADTLMKDLDGRNVKYTRTSLDYIALTYLDELLPGSTIDFIENNTVTSTMINLPITGNPAGILKAKEILIGVEDLDKARKAWGALMKPLPEIAEGQWQPGNGPSIHLFQAQANGVYMLKLKVKSLAQTEKFLKQNGLLGPKEKNSLKTNPAQTFGVIFEFEE